MPQAIQRGLQLREPIGKSLPQLRGIGQASTTTAGLQLLDHRLQWSVRDRAELRESLQVRLDPRLVTALPAILQVHLDQFEQQCRPVAIIAVQKVCNVCVAGRSPLLLEALNDRVAATRKNRRRASPPSRSSRGPQLLFTKLTQM